MYVRIKNNVVVEVVQFNPFAIKKHDTCFLQDCIETDQKVSVGYIYDSMTGGFNPPVNSFETEIALTELDLAAIENGIMLTDLDLRLIELEALK